MLDEKTKTIHCSIRMVCSELKDKLRVAFRRPGKESAKNDVAMTGHPLTPGTAKPEGVPLTRTLKCPRCSYILRIGPSASNPLDPEPVSDSSTPLSRESDCTPYKPREEPEIPNLAIFSFRLTVPNSAGDSAKYRATATKNLQSHTAKECLNSDV